MWIAAKQFPANTHLRMARAVPIGGLVVDPDGNPVAGAQVAFNNQPDPASVKRPQSDDFGWPFWITATTDAQGRWEIDRIGKEAIRSMYGSASHSDYVGTGMIFAGNDHAVEKQLLAKTLVLTLGPRRDGSRYGRGFQEATCTRRQGFGRS